MTATFETLTSSKSVEWYTPPDILEAARQLFGGIDLDPASCEEAQTLVKANRYYTKEMDGMTQPWDCRSMWLNPPYGKKNQKLKNYGVTAWVYRAANMYRTDIIKDGAVILIRGDSDGYKLLVRHCIHIDCHRINFLIPGLKPAESGGVPGSKLFYLGTDDKAFAKEFKTFGTLLKVYEP